MCCPPMQCACASWGGGDVEDVVRCALLERLGARRASSSCRGRGWGGTPRELQCRRHRHARAERRYGGSWQEGGARAASPSLQGLTPPARRPARRGRRVRVPRAFKRPAKTFGGGGWGWWQQLRLPHVMGTVARAQGGEGPTWGCTMIPLLGDTFCVMQPQVSLTWGRTHTRAAPGDDICMYVCRAWEQVPSRVMGLQGHGQSS